MDAVEELKEKTRDLRKGLLATTVLVDASVATCSEWLSAVIDYMGPQLNLISGKFLDHQLRLAFVTYGLSSTRPSPILCKRYFSRIETLKRDSLEIPELVGLGQVSNEESERDGMAMLDAFAAALEMFDLLDTTPNPNQTHILRKILHVAAYPPDNTRHPAWNVKPDLDHLSWSNLPQELRKRDIHYSSILIRPLPQLEKFHAAVCPPHETCPPWFEVRPHHKCLLWVPSNPAENIAAILNSSTPPTDFSPQEYQRLVEKYLTLSHENDRLVRAIRARDKVDLEYLRKVLQTDFPLYLQLQEYFNRLRGENLKSVDQPPLVFEDPTLGGSGELSCPVDVYMERGTEMQLASECNPNVMSVFSATAASVFAERPPLVSNQGPFGIQFSEFPPRVISQMLSTHTDGAASSSSWRGTFQWAGFERASRARKFMRIPMVGLSVTNGKDLRAQTWPQDMILLPSDTKRLNNAALEEWIKRYDPMWCQFVPHHNEGGNDTVMNDLVHRQLVQRLIDQCLYAVASWDVPNSPGLWNTLLLLPCNTSGLIGAVFSSVGKPELPTPSGPNSLAGPTQLFEDPIQKVVLMTELRSFCPFREPIQVVGRDQHCHGDRLSCHLEPGFDSINSGSESESGSRSRTESPGFCKTPEQRGWDYTQSFVPQLLEHRTHPEVTGSPQQTFAFDFDVDNGVWISTDPYLQLGNPLPKDQLDWFTQGLGFPEPLA